MALLTKKKNMALLTNAMTKNVLILSENATNATRDPETGVATTPGELAVTKPWKQRWLLPDLIFVTNITNIISGEKFVMWRNFSFPCISIVGKLKISPHVEEFQMSPHMACV